MGDQSMLTNIFQKRFNILYTSIQGAERSQTEVETSFMEAISGTIDGLFGSYVLGG